MWKRIRELGTQLTRTERGQTNVEYALILLLVALATIALLIILSHETNNVLMGSVVNSLSTP